MQDRIPEFITVFIYKDHQAALLLPGHFNIRQIDSGYIAAGGYQDQTKDFTATSGYNQLCINVNGKVDCNFQSVSTSLALNAIKDQALASASK